MEPWSLPQWQVPHGPPISDVFEVATKLSTGMQTISLRPLSDGDSLEELTAMLHRAFSRLGQMDLNCTCIDQSVAVTRERIEKGACYVAVCDGRLVGTITLYGPDPGSKSAWYHRQAVASIHQLGVDPEFQGSGLGTDLLQFAECWAREHGYRELALETPQPAEHLVAFYMRHGYRPVELVTFQGKRYRSLVLSKGVAEQNNTDVLVLPFLHSQRSGSSVGRPGIGVRRRISGIGARHPLARYQRRAGFSEILPHLRC
jgi:GNAT superfamily N-acetyltransferase